MEVLLAIFSVLLLVAIPFIFWLLRVLKNTLNSIDVLSGMVQNKAPRKFREAYNGKYYPAIVIAQLKFDAPAAMTLTDFSMYEKRKIVGFTIYCTESMKDYYGTEIENFEDNEELLELLDRPVILKNKEVFEVSEGVWAWRPQ